MASPQWDMEGSVIPEVPVSTILPNVVLFDIWDLIREYVASFYHLLPPPVQAALAGRCSPASLQQMSTFVQVKRGRIYGFGSSSCRFSQGHWRLKQVSFLFFPCWWRAVRPIDSGSAADGIKRNLPYAGVSHARHVHSVHTDVAAASGKQTAKAQSRWGERKTRPGL